MKQNLLDKAIGYVAPGIAARRVAHRARLSASTRSYAAARPNRSRDSWFAPSTSADAEVGTAGQTLRNRMRDLVRNNPHAANAVSVLVAHAIGDGIVPRTKDENVNALFKEWIEKCDASGQLDFYGIQALATRGMFESGNGMVRKRIRRASDNLPVPLQLEVFEVDLLDTSKHGEMSGGRKAVQGIEFDRIGRRESYWLWNFHPGDNYATSVNDYNSRPIPANQIAHVYEKQRTQVLGIPWGTPAIEALYDLKEYETAELTRKRLEACLVGVVTGGEDDGIGIPFAGEDDDENFAGVYDSDGYAVEKFEPGMFAHVQGGKDIKFSQPATTGGYDQYKDSNLHTIAAGFRVPHALLTGRLDKVNYSSSKIGLEHFHRTISSLQWHFIIPMLCQPIWDWFIEAAYLAGKIDSMDHPAEWTPPGRYSADPARDADAKIKEIRAGIRTWAETVSETGRGQMDVLEEHAETFDLFDQHGFKFTSDPRYFSDAGQLHQANDNKPPDKPAASDDEAA